MMDDRPLLAGLQANDPKLDRFKKAIVALDRQQIEELVADIGQFLNTNISGRVKRFRKFYDALTRAGIEPADIIADPSKMRREYIGPRIAAVILYIAIFAGYTYYVITTPRGSRKRNVTLALSYIALAANYMLMKNLAKVREINESAGMRALENIATQFLKAHEENNRGVPEQAKIGGLGGRLLPVAGLLVVVLVLLLVVQTVHTSQRDSRMFGQRKHFVQVIYDGMHR